MNNSVYIWHRGTRLARILRILEIPVQYQQDHGVWQTVNRPRKLRIGVNWGCLRPLPISNGAPAPLNSKAINAARKIRSFKLFNIHDIPCPEWKLFYNELNSSINAERTIFARKDGLSGGKGILVITPEMRQTITSDKLNEYDFFTARIPHEREFRVHVWGKEIIVTQVKFIEPGSKNPIHSYENGAKFSSHSISKFINEGKQTELQQLAVRAVGSLELFFGAVDIIMDPHGKFHVLEINTAPGIRSEPVEIAYRNAFKELIK